MKEGIHIVNLKKQKKYMSPYYFLFYISRRNKKQKITNSGQKSLTVDFIIFNKCSIDFYKIEKLKK